MYQNLQYFINAYRNSYKFILLGKVRNLIKQAKRKSIFQLLSSPDPKPHYFWLSFFGKKHDIGLAHNLNISLNTGASS